MPPDFDEVLNGPDIVIDMVWESQRRLTIFEPFEAIIDSSFSDGQGRPSGLSDTLPGRTWRWAEDWAVSGEEGLTDPEGWQYTTQIGGFGSFTPQAGQLSHARRRIWKRRRVRTWPTAEVKYWEGVLMVPEGGSQGGNQQGTKAPAAREHRPASTMSHSKSNTDVQGLVALPATGHSKYRLYVHIW